MKDEEIIINTEGNGDKRATLKAFRFKHPRNFWVFPKNFQKLFFAYQFVVNQKNTNEISENFHEIKPGDFQKFDILCDRGNSTTLDSQGYEGVAVGGNVVRVVAVGCWPAKGVRAGANKPKEI